MAGDIHHDAIGQRLAVGAGAAAQRGEDDIPIYQRLPQAAVFPKHAEDLERLAKLASEPPHRDIVLTPRGGGTGTNGQSLTDGIVVDVSRHMNQIIEIDVEARR